MATDGGGSGGGAGSGGPKAQLQRRLSKQQVRSIERQATDLIEDILSQPSTPRAAGGEQQQQQQQQQQQESPEGLGGVAAVTATTVAEDSLLPIENWLERRVSKHGTVVKFKRNYCLLRPPTPSRGDGTGPGAPLQYFVDDVAGRRPLGVYVVTASTKWLTPRVAPTSPTSSSSASTLRFTLSTQRPGSAGKPDRLHLQADSGELFAMWRAAVAHVVDFCKEHAC